MHDSKLRKTWIFELKSFTEHKSQFTYGIYICTYAGFLFKHLNINLKDSTSDSLGM